MATYRVEELARAAGVKIDTVRFYQTKGLLPPPKRVKREAVYSEDHLATLKRIRLYQSQGLPLAVIKRMLDTRPGSTKDALVRAVVQEGGERSLTRDQLAAQSGVPGPLIASIEAAGLLRPIQTDGKPRYGEVDLSMLKAGLAILKHGFPIHELLQLAIHHHKGVRDAADSAIDMFDRYVRKADAEGANPDDVADAFRHLLPAVTTLVALHFQRTLLSRALDRLRERGDEQALAVTKRVLKEGRLEVAWK